MGEYQNNGILSKYVNMRVEFNEEFYRMSKVLWDVPTKKVLWDVPTSESNSICIQKVTKI